MEVPAPPRGDGGLTREFLLSGGFVEQLRRVQPDFKFRSDAERAESLDRILAERPERGDGVLVFAYGSLIWNPAIRVADSRLARIEGWHRSFCLAVRGGRGTPELPGMLLGMEQGGECVGAALQVAEEDVESELSILWRREMVGHGYIPRWLPARALDGSSLGHAICFTIDPNGPSYAGDITERELIHRIANASGTLGTSWDYLVNTRHGLRELGIADPLLERIGAVVESLGMDI
jgi:glutathione-specific gamma-glutamylcyclotransferase